MKLGCIILLLGLFPTSAKECPGLGTFESTGPFEGWPEPYCPEELGGDLVFLMFNHDDPLEGEEFDRNSVPSIFDPSLGTVYIVHGWSRNINTTWIHDMKDAWLQRLNANVVLVGWGGPKGAQNLRYPESASTTRTVGAEVAETMVTLIIGGGATRQQMHCVGSSLGAQLCGHAGRWAATQHLQPIGRCTGLDPAGPLFANNTDRTVGIWTDTADFVDIIHTDTELGSTPEPGAFPLTLGHQDFFPNDGVDHPGCNGSHNCNHGRARQFFETSLNNDCFLAQEECTESNALPESCVDCGGTCAEMGYSASLSYDSGIYRLDTSADFPYCPAMYKQYRNY